MLGQKVVVVESTNQFDVTSLSSGNYIVKIVGCAKGRSLNGVLSGSYRGYPVKSPPGGRYKSVWSTNLPIKTEAPEVRAPIMDGVGMIVMLSLSRLAQASTFQALPRMS